MSPKNRFIGIVFFWIVACVILFIVRKVFFPEQIDTDTTVHFKISAGTIILFVGLFRILDTIYACTHGFVVSAYGLGPLKIFYFKANPFEFIFGFVFQMFIWTLLVIMTWSGFHEAILELPG